jgi:hypothetical protein
VVTVTPISRFAVLIDVIERPHGGHLALSTG